MIGLDQFQALVHQSGAVDGDLGTHRPVGMFQRLVPPASFSFSIGQLRNGPPDAVRTMRSTATRSAPASDCNAAECSLSTGSNSAPTRGFPTKKHRLLKRGIPCSRAPPACPAAPRERRLQTRRADDRRHRAICRTRGCLDQSIFARRRLDARAGEQRLEFAIARIVPHYRDLGSVQDRKPREFLGIRLRRQRHHLEPLGLPAHKVERALADRSRCAEHRQPLRRRQRPVRPYRQA